MISSQPGHPDSKLTRWSSSALLAGLLSLVACGGTESGTSLVLELTLGPGAAIPNELRVTVRHRDQDGGPLFEDQRLPRAGRLVAEAPPRLGTVVVELDGGGPVNVEVLGLREGRLSSRGNAQAQALAGEQVRVPMVLAAEPEPPPLPPPERVCTQSCGPCQRCATATGGCEALPAGAIDESPGGGCTGTRACDGRGACRTARGQRCTEAVACASGFCVDGVCCDSACGGPCRRCGDGTCTAIVGAVDPRSCTDGRICDARGECLKANGRPCASAQECASGSGADGVCCGSSCDAACRKCGRDGVCEVVIEDDDRECGGGRTCDERGICR
jgi:hypothetical protein